MRASGAHLQFVLVKPNSYAHTTSHLQRCPRLHASRSSFHSSLTCRKRSTSKYPSIAQSSVERINVQRNHKSRPLPDPSLRFTPFSKLERAELAKKYSPAQLASIDAGEAAISEQDLATQGKLRRDPFQFEYLDDFSRIEQTIDKKIEKLRGQGQDYENVEGYIAVPHDLSTFVKAAEVERQAEIENIGEWVPVQSAVDEHNDRLYQDPLNKLELRRTTHQIAKAALKEYLGTSTVQEAIEYCWNKDIDVFDQEHQGPGARPFGNDSTTTLDQGLLHGLDLRTSNPESDRPVESNFFENTIFPDQRYQDIFQRIKQSPPPPKHFGTPAVDTKVREIFDPPMPDVAPDVPKVNDPTIRWAPTADETVAQETSGLDEATVAAFERLSKSTGQSIAQLRRYRVKAISNHRVVNQTRLGKISSFYCLFVAGDEEGKVGLGEGKAKEPQEAVRMGRLNAIRNMVPIMRYENRTIYGEVSAKVGAAQVKLSARQPGFGLRTSRHVFEIAKCAGLVDLGARVTRSRNPMNVAKAVWQALMSQKNPEDIARARGKKLVDVRKVYYSGLI